MSSLVQQLMKAISEHDWKFQYSAGLVDGLVCTCGWHTSATDQPITRWTRHRDRKIREVVAEYDKATP